MVQFDFALAGKKAIEDVSVAVLSPPLAQLPVPRARQFEDQLRMLQPQQGEEILVAQVTLELVLFGQGSHRWSRNQHVVLSREAHAV